MSHSEREDFAKSAWRDLINRPISYENALLSFGSREKVSEHWGN